ncbi:hypothetical protein AB0G85_26540 [Streptomyces sioyaensis]|uniref:hypothetical protein n=1 Tax=Streptomyces sioyaensis TaxID=67364 RepID=UPI003402EA55
MRTLEITRTTSDSIDAAKTRLRSVRNAASLGAHGTGASVCGLVGGRCGDRSPEPGEGEQSECAGDGEGGEAEPKGLDPESWTRVMRLVSA